MSYILYKIDRWGDTLVGFYDDIVSAAGAIEEDKAKHDDNARYEVRNDGEDEENDDRRRDQNSGS